MNQDATVNAGDIARLVDVGRAAVSNWRRRHDDFPQPVGGTASSPLFSLPEVEEWLRRNGKHFEVSLADRTWQRVRAAGADLHLADRVAAAGAVLLAARDEVAAVGTAPIREHVRHRTAVAGGADRLGARVGEVGEGSEPAGDRLGRPRAAADSADVSARDRAAAEGSGLPLGARDTGAVEGGDHPAGRRAAADGAGEGVGRLPSEPAPLADPELVGLVRELGAQLGHREAFEFLFGRYLEAHSRRVSTTPPDVAALMTRLAEPTSGTVLDPACGFGTVLLATRNVTTLLGQDIDPTTATIAAIRLNLVNGRANRRITTAAGDSLKADALPRDQADAVVCDPPFNERAWGYQDLTGDPRWEYGLPPRGESELAWLQHCLAHVKPGGAVAILMPAAAASRRPGKRIRGNLLRAGALRAVISLGPTGPDIWLLRRPTPHDRPPEHLFLLTAHHDLHAVHPAWLRHLGDPTGSTRIIDLLDDDVDLSPLRHQDHDNAEEMVRDLRAASWWLNKTGMTAPKLAIRERQLQFTTIGELVKAGALTVRQAPARMPADGDIPVLTADDLAEHRAPSGWTDDDPGLVDVQPHDVVASVLGGATRVISNENAVLGPYLTRYRLNHELLDPDFLAGVIRAAEPVTHGGSSRTDVRRVRIPRLPLAEQREYGSAFRQLVDLEDTLRTAASAGETLVRLGFACLAAGHAVPTGRQD
ncbi:MAG TPA: N-6 DNA methylase [Pseudonocardiaceae bacterium]|nr:N-6 DNA methylase [Pseudonocardiaceae bacterium]